MSEYYYNAYNSFGTKIYTSCCYNSMQEAEDEAGKFARDTELFVEVLEDRPAYCSMLTGDSAEGSCLGDY